MAMGLQYEGKEGGHDIGKLGRRQLMLRWSKTFEKLSLLVILWRQMVCLANLVNLIKEI